MWCWLHFRSTCSHVSVSRELHIGHVIDGNLWMPKNNCFLALPMYWPVRNFRRVVFCESVIAGLDQNLLDNSLFMSGFIVHLEMFGNFRAITSRFFSRSCFWMYVSRHLTGPLSGLLSGPGHVSLWK
jgi:hypothetical protein